MDCFTSFQRVFCILCLVALLEANHHNQENPEGQKLDFSLFKI